MSIVYTGFYDIFTALELCFFNPSWYSSSQSQDYEKNLNIY